MRARVLVTGAGGFVGRHCLQPLTERGFEVHATGRHDPHGFHGEWHGVDLLEAGARRTLIEHVRPTHLLHLAWYLETGKYAESPRNLDGLAASIDLARLFEESGGRRMVTAGTCFEYDWSRPRLTESTPLRPRTMYGECKRLLFEALSAWAGRGGPSMAWARIFFLYGPGEDSARLAADIARSLLLGKEVATSMGTQRRDYMYVADAGKALAAIVASPVEGPVNVATGTAIPVADLVGAIADQIGRRHLVKFGARPMPPGDPDCLEADVTRLVSEVGWNHYTPLDVAVEETVDWWRRQLDGSAG